MIPVPNGARVWLAAGHTDMRIQRQREVGGGTEELQERAHPTIRSCRAMRRSIALNGDVRKTTGCKAAGDVSDSRPRR